MTAKIIGSALCMVCLILLTMASVPPQEKVALQIWTYVLWFGSGAMIAITFWR